MCSRIEHKMIARCKMKYYSLHLLLMAFPHFDFHSRGFSSLSMIMDITECLLKTTEILVQISITTKPAWSVFSGLCDPSL